MKTFVTKILIACLLAISLHGFGTTEHVFNADTDQAIAVDVAPGPNTLDRSNPILSAACDICQVVHLYVTLESSDAFTPAFFQPLYVVNADNPRTRIPDDILHPPTIRLL